MKKITHLIIPIMFLIFINACTGYKPIFSSSNLQFEIADYSIEGNKRLGKKIYSKLLNISKSNKNKDGITNIHITIKISKEKKATVKDSAGKTLEYKVNLNTKVIVKNYLTNDNILDYNLILSSLYKVQDQHSETKKLEAKSIEDLLNRTYQELLIKLSEKI